MSTEYKQAERPLAVETPLGPDKLLLTAFRGGESLSTLFEYELNLVSTDSGIAAADLVGQPVSFMVRRLNGEPRWFHGFVRRFGYLSTDDRLSHYRAQVVPHLWFLTQTTDCRIFQNKSVPDILAQVFDDLGLSDYDLSGISGTHDPWDYCVQYRESDFAFVSRLMEKEGIYYYFRHEQGRLTLMLADGTGGYFDAAEDQLEYFGTESGPDVYNTLVAWEHHYEFRSGRAAHTDYDFTKPSTPLMADTETVVKFDGVGRYELYDYPGGYTERNHGDREVALRMEEQEAQHDVVQGRGYNRTFTPGARFTLAEHPSEAERGGRYVLTRVTHQAELGGSFTTGSGGGSDFIYENSFHCIPDGTTFRPLRVTPKPRVHGSQTAVVVGPGGEEIYTDEYGRVKVQFHWDREGQRDEKSSCWVRVSQPWTGHRWGWQHIPRIDSEVVVTFLEGDPDQPLITGMVYNAESMPPYTLPDNKTQTGIKTRSSRDGDDQNFNEIRFEDLKGEEQLYIHAERNQDIEVEVDETHWVGQDRRKTIDRDEVVEVKRDRTETVGRDESITVEGDRDEEVHGDETLVIRGSRSDTVRGSDSQSITRTLLIDAGQSITIKSGLASITLSASGEIAISGTNIVINGKSSASMTSTGAALVKGNPTVIN